MLMMDFEAELKKLLAGEGEPLPQGELAEVLAESRNLLEALYKKQADLSLQVEEIYDLAKDADTRELQGVLNVERGRSQQLLGVVVGLSDMLEHFCVYAGQSGSAELEHQGRLLWQNARRLLESCGIVRLGEAGQPLDPALHTVQSAVVSALPKEHVVQVLQSGYLYLGMMLRKAVVVVSMGSGNPNPEVKDRDDEDREEDEDRELEDVDAEAEDMDAEEDDEDTDAEEDVDIDVEEEDDTEGEDTGAEDVNPEAEDMNTRMEDTENEQNRWD
jgi:molecular chaperone GrpE (heat shock protein)